MSEFTAASRATAPAPSDWDDLDALLAGPAGARHRQQLQEHLQVLQGQCTIRLRALHDRDTHQRLLALHDALKAAARVLRRAPAQDVEPPHGLRY